MIENTLAQAIGISRSEVGRLLALPPAAIYQDNAYCALVTGLDADLLFHTLPDARAAFDFHIPIFQEKVRGDHPDINIDRMTASTLSTWLIGFLQAPDGLDRLHVYHAPVPPDFIRAYLPDLIDMLNDIVAGREEWRRALAIMSLPLMTADISTPPEN
jgi:hypothetical protein